MDNNLSIDLATHVVICVATCVVLLAKNGHFDAPQTDVGALVEAAAAVRRIDRRQREEESTVDGTVASKKIKFSDYDYERARTCVYQDHLGPDPFFGRQFERIFRVSRGIFERLWQIVATADDFFQY